MCSPNAACQLWVMRASPLTAPAEELVHLAALALQKKHLIRGIAVTKVLLLCRHQPGGGGPALCARLQAAALWRPGCDEEAAESPQRRAGQQSNEAWGAGAAEAQDHALCRAGSTDRPRGEMLVLHHPASHAPDLQMPELTMHAKCHKAALLGAGRRYQALQRLDDEQTLMKAIPTSQKRKSLYSLMACPWDRSLLASHQESV